mmetsp:Transcript_29154/g.92061  ORF Transcript_29154/g.92061 Transcript_29154/m.92061 type:complete len:259 (+) Transcript_29154:65-841(+)
MSAPDGMHAAFFRTAGTLGKLYKRSHAFLPQRVRGQFALLLNEIKPFLLPPVPLCTADLHRGRPEVSVIADALVRLACKGDFVLEVPALQPPRVLHLADVLPAPCTPPARAGAPTSSTPPRPLRAEAPCFVPASLTDGLDRSVKDSQPSPGECAAGHEAGVCTASPLDGQVREGGVLHVARVRARNSASSPTPPASSGTATPRPSPLDFSEPGAPPPAGEVVMDHVAPCVAQFLGVPCTDYLAQLLYSAWGEIDYPTP